MEQYFLFNQFGASDDWVGHMNIVKASGNSKGIHVEAVMIFAGSRTR